MVEIQSMDYWTLFVHYVFGGFWMAVVGLGLAMFIIMGVLGRMSIYSVTWYIIMFILALTLGYGFVTLNIIITFALIVAFFFSWKSYFDNK